MSQTKIIKQVINDNKYNYIIETDNYKILSNEETTQYLAANSNLNSNNILVPLQQYIDNQVLQQTSIGVWLSSDTDINLVKPFIESIPIIAFNFETFRDGRAYSNAYLLKTRLGYKGIIRAIGDVLRDQLAYMARCGFNEFAVRSDKDINDAIKGFIDFSQNYQADVLADKAYYNRDI